MSDGLTRRDTFLIALYDQLMNDINRHIVVVWQSVATLVGAVAAFGLIEKQVITVDVAVSLVLLTCIWLIQHVHDASYWYNRNLVMIANIERQFLVQSDLKNIHYYFGKHRPVGSMISHLRIQLLFGASVGGLMLVFQFQQIFIPLIEKGASPSFMNFVPWIISFVGIGIWLKVKQSNARKYEEFLRNSPGIEVTVQGITYGVGHGFENEK